MSSACVLALLAALGTEPVQAEEANRPTIWIELGGQLERWDGAGDRFIAPFMTPETPAKVLSVASPIEAQRPPRYSIGEEAKITLMPAGSEWVLSTALRYGRSNSKKKTSYQTQYPPLKADALHILFPSHFPIGYISPVLQNYSRNTVRSNESHLILDFMAGRDVGLGMFGRDGSSTLQAGVRFAQFASRATVDIHARPAMVVTLVQPFEISATYTFHNYALSGHAARSFSGVGPSLSWSGSAAVLGEVDTAELALDWGLNAAVLFGRQKTRVDHRTTAYHFSSGYLGTVPAALGGHYQLQYQHAGNPNRSHSVAVPNVGGFAGLSLKFPNAKVSLGYRMDAFFGAMDAGMDVRKTGDVLFHGPFAAITVGLGG
jgi:hypothetical protein